MSNSDRPVYGPFSGNVNSNNWVISGDGANARYLQHIMRDMMRGQSDNGEPPGAEQSQWTESSVRTQPEGLSPTQSGNLSVNNASRNSPFLPEGAIFGEPRDKTPEPASEEVEAYGVPVREPPAWKLNYKIGSGSFGTVFLEKVQTRGMDFPELWAVKVISLALPNFPAKRYQQEIENLKALSNHEWFVKFNTSYQDGHYVYIAMEYIPIGDMTKTFVKGYRWNESDTKVVIEQLLRGLVVMHKEGITHRDLKPENIFLYLPEDETQVLRVKIGDFGTSKRIPLTDSTTYLKTSAGTQGYMAPEMDDTSKIKTNRVDVWSLGCILYRMIAGSSLFNSRNEVYRYSLTRSPPLPAVEKIGLSVACVDFLREVLKPEPMDRPSAEDCLKKAWITSKGPGSEYSVGRVLYKMLSQIQLAAPDIDSFSDAVAKRAADNAPTRSLSAAATPATNSTANTLRSSKTFNTRSSRGF